MKRIPYATQWIDKDDIGAVDSALKSEYLTQGPKVAEFEAKVADYCGAKYAVAVNSGTAALHSACFAAGIGAGDEVITSPITFVASPNCVLYCGGKPVFADIQAETVNIDPEQIEKNVTPATKAMIPVHFSGQPCELERIWAIARKHALLVIEDAAHALGAEYNGAKIGAGKYSDMTVLSFHAVKHITTGEGGMVLTNSEKLYGKLLMFRTHGITRETDRLENKNEGAWHYEMQSLGFNYRITDFQCALGVQQLKKLEKFIARRREIVNIYNENFKNIGGITLPQENGPARSAWHLYVIKAQKDRREVFDALRAAGIGVNVHYRPVYLQPYYRQLGYHPGQCPNAEDYYRQAITLPLYPKMSNDDVRHVIDVFKQVIHE